MNKLSLAALGALALGLSGGARALEFADIEATQTGGFYAGLDVAQNSPTFQNFFVGYGTSAGTDERTPSGAASSSSMSRPCLGRF